VILPQYTHRVQYQEKRNTKLVIKAPVGEKEKNYRNYPQTAYTEKFFLRLHPGLPHWLKEGKNNKECRSALSNMQ